MELLSSFDIVLALCLFASGVAYTSLHFSHIGRIEKLEKRLKETEGPQQ